ncbi:MAG: RING finger protein [Anaeromassilibacillus sp.]
MDYTGLKCPVCGKPFTSDDDIVVCPECGAPYHRACYQQAGHCIFQEKHGTPDAWKPRKSKRKQTPKEDLSTLRQEKCP